MPICVETCDLRFFVSRDYVSVYVCNLILGWLRLKKRRFFERRKGVFKNFFWKLSLISCLGCWFGATVDDEDGYALVGCTVSPGFDFEDFELATYEYLVKLCPDQAELIKRMTL